MIISNKSFRIVPKRIPKKTNTKPSAKRALDLSSTTDANILLETVKDKVEDISFPTKMSSKTKSLVPFASAGTVRLGR